MIGDPTCDFVATCQDYMSQTSLPATTTGGAGQLMLEEAPGRLEARVQARLQELATELQEMKDREKRRDKGLELMKAKLSEVTCKLKLMTKESDIKMKASISAEVVKKVRAEMEEGQKVWKELVKEMIVVKKKVADVEQLREEVEGIGGLRREVEDVRLLRRELAEVKELVQAVEESLHSRVEELQPPGASLEGVMAEVAALTAELEQVVGLNTDIAVMKAELLATREMVEELAEGARTRARVLGEINKEMKDELAAMKEMVKGIKEENDKVKEGFSVEEDDDVKQEEVKTEKRIEKVDEGGDSKNSEKDARVEKEDDLSFDFVSVKPRLVRKGK